MIDHIVSPRSMQDIRGIIRDFKIGIGLNDSLYFPIVYFFDNILPDVYDEYKFLIIDEKELPGQYGYTDHKNKVVKMRNDVYEGALKEKPKDLFTIAHEIGHLFLHAEEGYIFSRTVTRVPSYLSAEWQANYFAAEFLMPSHLIIDLDEETIRTRCKTSLEATRIQLKHAREEYAKNRL